MKYFFASLLIFSSTATFAQVPLNSVVEHFTNTQCSACASRNPGFTSNVDAHPQITHLSIHPSIPYAGCILSKQNKKDNDDRTKFYGIFSGTPRIVINGDVISASTSYSTAAIFTPYLGLMTPVSMRIEQNNYGTDSIVAKVIIKKHAATTTDARLFIGLAEDSVFVNGGNGELEHYNVLRQSLTGLSPQMVSLAFAVGDSVTVSMKGTVNSFWNINRMFVIAILHEDASNKVMQSAKTAPMKTASVRADQEQITFSIHPNPASTSINIGLPNNNNVTLDVYDMLGKPVAQKSFARHTTINVAELPNGFYLFQLKDGQSTAQQKVFIQH
jgi:hypothetical protein